MYKRRFSLCHNLKRYKLCVYSYFFWCNKFLCASSPPPRDKKRRGNGEIMTKEGNYVIKTLNVAKLNLNRFPEITFRVSSFFRSLRERRRRRQRDGLMNLSVIGVFHRFRINSLWFQLFELRIIGNLWFSSIQHIVIVRQQQQRKW